VQVSNLPKLGEEIEMETTWLVALNQGGKLHIVLEDQYTPWSTQCRRDLLGRKIDLTDGESLADKHVKWWAEFKQATKDLNMFFQDSVYKNTTRAILRSGNVDFSGYDIWVQDIYSPTTGRLVIKQPESLDRVCGKCWKGFISHRRWQARMDGTSPSGIKRKEAQKEQEKLEQIKKDLEHLRGEFQGSIDRLGRTIKSDVDAVAGRTEVKNRLTGERIGLKTAVHFIDRILDGEYKGIGAG